MFVPHAEGWDAVEQRALLGHRWWTVDELRTTDERLYPQELATLVQAVLAGSISTPVRLSATWPRASPSGRGARVAELRGLDELVGDRERRAAVGVLAHEVELRVGGLVT